MSDLKTQLAALLGGELDLAALKALIDSETARVKQEAAQAEAVRKEAQAVAILAKVDLGKVLGGIRLDMVKLGMTGLSITLTETGVGIKPMWKAIPQGSATPGERSSVGTGTFIGDKATWMAVVPQERRDKDELEIARLLKEDKVKNARAGWHIRSRSIKEFSKKAS